MGDCSCDPEEEFRQAQEALQKLAHRLADGRLRQISQKIKQQQRWDNAPRHTEYQGHNVNNGGLVKSLGGNAIARQPISNGWLNPGDVVEIGNKGGFDFKPRARNAVEEEEAKITEKFFSAILSPAYAQSDTFNYFNFNTPINNTSEKFIVIGRKVGAKYEANKISRNILINLNIGSSFPGGIGKGLDFNTRYIISNSGFDLYTFAKNRLLVSICKSRHPYSLEPSDGIMSSMIVYHSNYGIKNADDNIKQQQLKLTKSIDLFQNITYPSSDIENLINGSDNGLIVKFLSSDGYIKRCAISCGSGGVLVWDLNDFSDKSDPACYFGFANPVFTNPVGLRSGVTFLGAYGASKGIVVRFNDSHSGSIESIRDCFIGEKYLIGEFALDISNLLRYENIPLRGHMRSPFIPMENVDLSKVADLIPNYNQFPEAWKMFYAIEYPVDKNKRFYQ